MNDEIIAEMATLFRKGIFTQKTIFCFLVDDTSVTVSVDAESYSVEVGVAATNPDCSCKTSGEMFLKIWYDGYKPGIMEFLGGAIKSNNPLLLPRFLAAFGK